MNTLIKTIVAVVLSGLLISCTACSGAMSAKHQETDELSAPSGTDSVGLLENSAGSAAGTNSTDQTQPETWNGEEPPELSRRQFLVKDADLYGKMVRGRYYDLWSRRSAWLTDRDVYAYERTLDKINGQPALYLSAELAGRILDRSADREMYIYILEMLICQQAAGFSQAADTLTDYDLIKSADDYKDDLAEWGWSAIDAFADTDFLFDAASDTYNIVSPAKEIVELTVDDYQRLSNAAQNYGNACFLLDTIERYSSDPVLLEAVSDLKLMLERVRQGLSSGNWKTMGGRVTGAIAENKDLFIEVFVDTIASEPAKEGWAKKLSDMCGNVSDLNEALAPCMAVWNFGYKGMMIGADGNFGTTDTFYRFAELRCLSEIAKALSSKALSEGYEPARETTGISKAKEMIPVLEYLLLTRLRGEHSLKELVLNNGRLQSEFRDLLGELSSDVATRDEIMTWFDGREKELCGIYSEVQMVVLSGKESYFRHLKDQVLPNSGVDPNSAKLSDYGWASLDTFDCPIPNWNNPGASAPAMRLQTYTNTQTGAGGTGVLAADVRDYDGDGVYDMLVFFVDHAPELETAVREIFFVDHDQESETALREVYSANEAVTLRMAIYHMQYDKVLWDEQAKDAPKEEKTKEGLSAVMDRPDTMVTGDDFDNNLLRMIRELPTRSIKAPEWTETDRYTVYESDVVKIAAEMPAGYKGRILAGICEKNGLIYIYTYEEMADSTTDGPHLLRFWHIENGKFVLDYANGLIGWGQGSKVDNVSAYLGAKGIDIADTQLSVVGKLVERAYPSAADVNERLVGSLMCRLTFEAVEQTQTGGTLRYEAQDHSFARTIMKENSFDRPLPPIPDYTPAENPGRDAMDRIADEVGTASGYPLQVSQNSEDSGEFIVWYRSESEQSTLTIRTDDSGKIRKIDLSSNAEDEFFAIKDAVLQQEDLGLDAAFVEQFLGDCSYGHIEFQGGSGYVNKVMSFVFGIDFE